MPPCARPPLVRSTAIAVSPVVPAEPGGAHEQIHRRVHRRTSTDSRAQVTPLPLSQMAPVFKGDSINHEKRTPRTRGWHGSTVVRRLPSPSRLPHPLSYLSLSSPSPSLFSLPLTLALSLSLSISLRSLSLCPPPQPPHLRADRSTFRHLRRRPRTGRRRAVISWLTAAIPMDNPYCGCKHTGAVISWLTAAIPMDNPYCGCKHIGAVISWLTAAIPMDNPYCGCKLLTRVCEQAVLHRRVRRQVLGRPGLGCVC